MKKIYLSLLFVGLSALGAGCGNSAEAELDEETLTAYETKKDELKERFSGMTVEEASALGYEFHDECVNGSEVPGFFRLISGIPKTAAMGFHAHNSNLFDDEVNVDEPETLFFCPIRRVKWNF